MDQNGRPSSPAPSYRTVMPQTSTLPTPIPRKSGHSARASALSHEVSLGIRSQLDYLALTFSTLIYCGGHRVAYVVAIDEDLRTLREEIVKIFNNDRITYLEINWAGGSIAQYKITEGNIVALLRLMKQRSGVDTITAVVPKRK